MLTARARLDNRFAAFVHGYLNRYLDRYTGGSARPIHFDIDRTCPALHRLTREWETIRREFDGLRRASMPRYHELDPHVARISAGEGPAWRVFLLSAMGRAPTAARACPRTLELLRGIPGLFQAFFSVLEPGKSVPSHEGPFRGYLRYHLGLRVPAENPPHLRVKDWVHCWREGEAILFDDSWEHEVINRSPGARAVLIVDILRPLPPWPHFLEKLYVRLLARPLYGRNLLKRMG